MATSKVEINNIFQSNLGYFDFALAEMFLL